jgi:signal transduction histidine kinase
MLGRPVKDVLQIHAADGSALADDEWPFDTAMLRGEASSRDDCAFVDGHNKSFGVSLTSGPLWREGLVSGAVLAFRSTSEQDRSHSALRAAVERAQRDTHDREDLLALVSHDLKNPLSIILMTASSLARTFEAADQGRQRGQLDSIKRSAERMNRLVKDLLDTASLEAGSLSVEPCSCAVAPLLEEALRSMRPLAAHKSIRLEHDIASDVPAVRADSGRIEQVFSNLLGNAIKFTPKDGIITLRVRVRDGMVLFAVSDTGPGMSESELPHLFDRYWQARRTAKLGTGLGLSIVKGIVMAHGGQVWVESQVGAGSTFFFTLPIA